MAIVAYIDSKLSDKAQTAVREFAALPAKEDVFSQTVSRLAALAALNTGKGLEDAITACENALDSSGYETYRAQGVSYLARLYARVGREKEAISLIERELKHPSIAKNEASVRLLKLRLDTLQHRGERAGHLSALTKKWLEEIRLPWLDFAKPGSLSDPGIADIDEALTITRGTMTSCERVKYAALVDEDDSQPEKRQLLASWFLGYFSCLFAPDSETAGHWARSFLDFDDLPLGVREAFLSGGAAYAFAEGDSALFESLHAHPVQKTINSQGEELIEQWRNYFSACETGDAECERLGESLLRKPLTVSSLEVFQRIVVRLSAHGEFEKAKRLLGALGAVPDAMDSDNGKAAAQLTLIKVLARDQKWRPINNAIREIVLARFGKDPSPPLPIVPSSDDRLLSLNLPMEEATRLRLQAMRRGRFPSRSDRFWVQFMQDLPRTAENLALRRAILRAAVEGAPDDATRIEVIKMTELALDIDSPEELRAGTELLAPLRKANSNANTADELRLLDFKAALRAGAPMDAPAALSTIHEDQARRVANSAALAAALAQGNQPLMRSLVESLSPQELVSDRMILYSLSAYRALGMKEEADLAEQSARRAVYRLVLDFWVHGDSSSAVKAFRLADLLRDPSLIPPSTAERLIDSRHRELTKLTIGGEEALYRRDWEKEVKLCEEALQKFPSYYHFLFLQGRALAALHRKEDAMRSLNAYVSIVHNEPQVREAKDLIDQLSKTEGQDEDGKK
jgi:tetratricopeptide (TPR) repeat protein